MASLYRALSTGRHWEQELDAQNYLKLPTGDTGAVNEGLPAAKLQIKSPSLLGRLLQTPPKSWLKKRRRKCTF